MIMLIISNIDMTLLNLLLGYSSIFTKSLRSDAGTGSERRLSGGMKNKDLKKRWAYPTVANLNNKVSGRIGLPYNINQKVRGSLASYI